MKLCNHCKDQHSTGELFLATPITTQKLVTHARREHWPEQCCESSTIWVDTL